MVRSLENYSLITALSRYSECLDLFTWWSDGCMYTCNWSPKDHWSSIKGKWKSLGGRGLAGANVAAVARRADHIDLFVCGGNGRVSTKWWAERSGWSERWKSLGGSFPAGANISAVARKPNKLGLFACGIDGHVYTCWWTENEDGWSGVSRGWKCLGGKLLAGSNISALARKPEQLDI